MKIYITREDFRIVYGVEPEPDVAGITMMLPSGQEEIIFVDNPQAQREVTELERLYEL